MNIKNQTFLVTKNKGVTYPFKHVLHVQFYNHSIHIFASNGVYGFLDKENIVHNVPFLDEAPLIFQDYFGDN